MGGVIYVNNLYHKSAYFRFRVSQTEKGDTSRRDVLYTKIWDNFWADQDVAALVFGHGADSTIKAAKNYAHQDWLETLYDTGILGIAFLIYFFLCFGRLSIGSLHSLSPPLATSLITLFLIVLISTFFSMSIQSLATGTSMLIGFFTAIKGPGKIKKRRVISG